MDLPFFHLTEPDRLQQLIVGAVQLIVAIATGLLQAAPQILEAMLVVLANILTAIWEALPEILLGALEIILQIAATLIKYKEKIFEAGVKLIKRVIDAIKEMFPKIKEKGKEIVEKVKAGFSEKVEEAKQWGKDLIQNFIDGVLAKWEALKETVKNVAQSVKDFLGFSEPKLGPLSNFSTYAPDMMNLFMQGIEDNKEKLLDTVADAFNFEGLIVKPTLNGDESYNDRNRGTQGDVYNINIYQPVKSASEMARQLREEAQYGLIGGGSFAY